MFLIIFKKVCLISSYYMNNNNSEIRSLHWMDECLVKKKSHPIGGFTLIQLSCITESPVLSEVFNNTNLTFLVFLYKTDMEGF